VDNYYPYLTTHPTIHVTVACINRPPGTVTRQFCDQFADMLDQLVTAKQRFMICGDFNCPGRDGCQLDVNLVDVLQRYDLVQHVVDATRGAGREHAGPATDTVDDTRLLSQTSVQSTCFSDHRLVTSQLHMSRQTSTTSH